MLVNTELVKNSIQRLDFNPDTQSRNLGDGPRKLSPSQKRNRYQSLLAVTGDPARARDTLERFIGGNDLVSINYLARGMAASRSVCRVRLRDRERRLIGYGTGFLVAPGVLMTNEHVLSAASAAANSLCDFSYELDHRDRECPTVSFRLEPARLFQAVKALDFTLCAVAPRAEDGRALLRDFLHLPLRPEPGKGAPGEYLSIVQHPSGERKQVCVRENKLLKYDTNTVWYMTDTVPGSSGSPVFNNLWQVVALHHSGVPRQDASGNWLTTTGRKWDPSMDETQVDWIANEGIRISRIVGHLKQSLANHPLVQAVLKADDPLPTEKSDAKSAGVPGGLPELRDGELILNLPIRIAMRVGDWPLAQPQPIDDAVAAGEPAPLPDDHVPPPAAPLPIEAVFIDQTNYDQRNGYNPRFLGGGGLEVPLPIPKIPRSQILTYKFKGKTVSELKYYHYSVVMHARRKLAIVAAVNIDGNQLQDVGKREGDKWYEDTRVPGHQITTQDFYSIQLREADRSLNPFDRGHLVRRLDSTWGATPSIAKRNGDDTFHYPNCSPQFWKFNQGVGSRLWAGLEDYALNKAVSGRKLCVLNGPVFDAPKSRIDDGDGRPFPNPTGQRVKDSTLLGVPIPRWFWKVIVSRAGQKLDVRAYVLSQEEFLEDIDGLVEEELRLRPLTEAQAQAFRIPLASLGKLARLDFGPLAGFDTLPQEGSSGIRPLQSFDDA